MFDETEFAVLIDSIMDQHTLQLARQSIMEFPLVVSYLIPGAESCSTVLTLAWCVLGLPAVHSVPLNGTTQLLLTPELLGQILVGDVDYWDDPAIVELNPLAEMPHLPIWRVFVSALRLLFFVCLISDHLEQDNQGLREVSRLFIQEMSDLGVPNWNFTLGVTNRQAPTFQGCPFV